MGALTITNRTDGVIGNKRFVEADVAFAASYATAGDTFTPASIGLKQVDEVHIASHKSHGRGAVSDAQAQTGFSVQLGGTASAPKLKLYSAAGTEAANASDQSAVATRVRFVGS